MKRLKLLTFALLLGFGIAAQAQSLVTTVENNEPTTLRWEGIWEVQKSKDFPEATVAIPPDPNDLLHGPWSASIKVSKIYDKGSDNYRILFSGAHNGTAKVESLRFFQGEVTPYTDSKTGAHGSIEDQWTFQVTPEAGATTIKIKWLVTATHAAAPEPATCTAIAAGGLLIFGFVRRTRACSKPL